MFVIKKSGKLTRFADKQIRDNGGHRVGPFLWVKPVPTMPAGLARGLLLGRDKRRLVRQALDRSLLRSLIQLTVQCHARKTLRRMSAP